MKLNVAVILPERYRGGTLRGALNITRMLAIGAKESGDVLELSFGHIDAPEVYVEDDFQELRELGVRIRPFQLEVMAGSKLDPLYDTVMSVPGRRRASEYSVFNDGISNFEDADFWIIVSDRLRAPIPPHRKYAVVVYDYIQRYVPDIFGTSNATNGNWMQFERYAKASRNADFVICTTEQTRQDCISYIGAESSRVYKFPQEFDPIDSTTATVWENSSVIVPYIIWTTNSTQHKNHRNVIAGLEKFLLRNSKNDVEIRMTGVYTHLFDSAGKRDPHFNDPYAVDVRNAIARTTLLKSRLKILGNLDDVEYRAQLAGARWLLHGAVYDNGTFSLIEAAWYGVPSISAEYPAIHECCENFYLDVALFDPYSPDSLCQVLESVIDHRDDWSRRLPGRDRLSNRSYENVAPSYWCKFKDAYISTVASL